jgi:hypothetical protein
MQFANFDERLASFSAASLPTLRPAQRSALEAFDRQRTTQSDIGIELPTGAGKTLIALLIADQALEEGRTVAYLTGTKQLAEQVVEQAGLLEGLDVVLFAAQTYPAQALRRFNDADAVGVMNYWAYFNTHPRVQPADLVIFDDAHLAEQALSGMFTIRIPRISGGGAALYKELADLVLQHAPDSYPSLQALRDGTAPWNTPPELVSFVDWATLTSSAADAISSSAYFRNGDLKYPWQVVQPQLRHCGVLIGPTAIEIRPYHVPTQTVPGYTQSKQRIYLSATLGQSGDIQRRLGTRTVIPAATAADAALAELGTRTFLINPTQDATLSDQSWTFALDQVDATARDGQGRVAWLCSSHAEADVVQNRLESEAYAVTRLRGGEEVALERWRDTRNGHLVTAGRFDGLDFADDVCRLVIIPSVPAASTEFERFVVAYLGDASYMRYRVGQRVTQALGRANRTPDDSALYIGLDPAFGAVLADAPVQDALGRDVRTVVNDALEYHGGTWASVGRAARAFWDTHRHPGPERLVEPATTTGRLRPGRGSRLANRGDSAAPEVNAVTRLWLGDSGGAAQQAHAAAQELRAQGEIEHAAFWEYVQAQSLYGSGRPADVAAARDALQTAVVSAPQTAWFVRLQRTIDALTGSATTTSDYDALFLGWDDWIRESGTGVKRRLARARSQIEGTHDERAEALVVLARLCGAFGDRPTQQSATDARWVWASPRKGQRRVWEVKTGGPDRIPREDINQILGQMQDEQHSYQLSRVVGCLLTPFDELEDDAARAARDKIVVVTTAAATALLEAMTERFNAYYALYGTGTASERGQARQAVEPRIPAGDWLNTLLSPRALTVLRRADVDTLFPP